MKSLIEVYEHNLKEMYYIERFLVEMLPRLKGEATSKDIKDALDIHQKETIRHVENLERVFVLTGIEIEEKESDLWKKMEAEVKKFFNDSVSSEARDFFVLESAIKSERLEMSHYETLILLTKYLDLPNEREVLSLLRENLADEEVALDKARSAMKSYLPLFQRSIH